MKMKMEHFFDGWEENELSLEETGLGDSERVKALTLQRIREGKPRRCVRFGFLLAAVITVLLIGTAAAITIRQIQLRKAEGELRYEDRTGTAVYHEGNYSGVLTVPAPENAAATVIGVRIGMLPELGEQENETVTTLRDSVRHQLAFAKCLQNTFPGKTANDLTQQEWATVFGMLDRYLPMVTDAEIADACGDADPEGAVTQFYCRSEDAAVTIAVFSGLTSDKEFVLDDDCQLVRQGTIHGMDALYLTRDRTERSLQELPEEMVSIAEPFFVENLLVLYSEEYACYLCVAGNAAAFDFATLEEIALDLELVPTACPVATATDTIFGGVFPGIGEG